MWSELRNAGMCYNTMQADITLNFQELQDSERNALANQLCDIHTVIQYTLRTQVLPEYIKNQVTGGEQTVHWEPLVPGSKAHAERQLALEMMEKMQAGTHVPGAKGKLLDVLDWRLDQSDSGMLYLLHRELPSSSTSRQTAEVDNEEEANDENEVLTDTATRSKSTIVLASTFIRAMHTAVVVLGRQAHPRSILCPLTSTDWNLLVSGYGIPECLLQGDKVTPRFKYASCGGEDMEVNPDWEFLSYRSAQPFFRDIYIGHVHFAVRAMALARQNKPGASMATLHKECRRVALATKLSAKAGFDHALTVVNSMLQNSKDLFEPDAAAFVAIEAFRPDANIESAAEKGRLLQAEVRRQLALYHQELVQVSRTHRNTMSVAANLDSGGLDVKQAQGRLPEKLALITHMIAQLWEQVYAPVWSQVIEPWLQRRELESTVQSYLGTKDLEGFTEFAEKQGLTQHDIDDLRTLLQLELSFLRSQVWVSSLVAEFKVIDDQGGRKLYEFRTSRSFKTADKAAVGSLPAASRWPLSERQSALVHTLLRFSGGSHRIFPGLSQQAVSKTFSRVGWNWCGIPRLGAHAMRTYHCCKAVNEVEVQDYPALASRMQVSADTMTAVYVAQSLKGPAAQLAFMLHASEDKEHVKCVEEAKQAISTQQEVENQQQMKKQKLEREQQLQRKQQQHVQQLQQQELLQQQQCVQFQQQQLYTQQFQFQQQQQQYLFHPPWLPQVAAAVSMPPPVPQPVPTPVPYGRALSTLRHKHTAAIKVYLASLGFCTSSPPGAARVAAMFQDLCGMRNSNSLPAEAKWFAFPTTFFDDKHEKPFKDFIRKLCNSSSDTSM
jgi:hypothetical protein